MGKIISTDQYIVMVVQASKKTEAQKIIRELNVRQLLDMDIVSTGELCIAKITTNEHLVDKDYDSIKNDNRVAILHDSDSKLRGGDVLCRICDVETHLRMLLVYMPGVTGQFNELIRGVGKYSKKYNSGQFTMNQLDPVVGHLTFGEMLDLLGTDLSVYSQKSGIVLQELEKIISSTGDFNDFKKQMSKMFQQRFVWDVIAEQILDMPVMWNDIGGKLNKLLKTRNSAAHFQVITDEDKKECLKLADEVLERTTIKKTVKKADMTRIADQLYPFVSVLYNFSFSPAISGMAAAQQQLSMIDFSMLNRGVSSAVEAVCKNANAYNMNYFEFYNAGVKAAAESLSDTLKVFQNAAYSLQDRLSIIEEASRISSLPWGVSGDIKKKETER